MIITNGQSNSNQNHNPTNSPNHHFHFLFELQPPSMAFTTDHQDPIDPPKPKPKSRLPTKTISPKSPPPSPNPDPFTFWFHFTLTVSLLTLLFILISPFNNATPSDPKSRFLTLPSSLRSHYSKGRVVKVQINPNESPIEVFTYSNGPRRSESVVIVHGLGCSSFTFREIVDYLGANGVWGVAIDLPGSGFSDKVVESGGEREGFGGVFGKFVDVYDEIREKGLFWGFDNLIEHGHFPVEEEVKAARVSSRKRFVALELGAEEVGRVLGQVVDSLGLAPVHLVLHDSALLMSANWVLENAGLLRSVTLVDSVPSGAALPLWVFEVRVVREVVLGFDFVFGRLIDSCCSKSTESLDVEAHRTSLKSGDGRQAIVGMGRKLNYSFELADWANSDAVKGVPIQVVWSSGLSV
ncbi:AUXIN RESPONSE 4-like protein [Drosera capensis]